MARINGLDFKFSKFNRAKADFGNLTRNLLSPSCLDQKVEVFISRLERHFVSRPYPLFRISDRAHNGRRVQETELILLVQIVDLRSGLQCVRLQTNGPVPLCRLSQACTV
ncbi:hypothetical protein RRG08_003826 [Elysia crispata]|uniref:Uncharacterized protein n=1 Tax=Elysia crispata TaxID=231223 RepID=A0AAE1DEC3_9GAST|nr:hypothetical protein RRG08_003826 [Elysia crispata]